MRSLPQPNGPFDWVQAAPGAALVCRPLLDTADHFFTTRTWALGKPPAGPERPGWLEVAQAIGVEPAHLVRARQVHGAAVVIAGESAHPADGDIIIANADDLAVAVQAADCVPILIADRSGGAVAAAHAGWRGLARGVPAAAVAALGREFGSRASDLVAAIGPSIGACCYEVGADVRDAFQAAFPGGESTRWFAAAGRPGKWQLDTWASARAQLEAAGIPAGQIFEAGLCTASHPEVLCSYRREGAFAGRIAGAIKRRRGARPRP